MNATERAMHIVRAQWHVAGCQKALKAVERWRRLYGRRRPARGGQG
jgi:hypothetical protein